MSDLRDELAIALGCRARKVITDPQRLTALFEWALAEAVLPITERRLAAERAATIDECHVAILEALDRRRPHDAAWLEPMRIVKETALALPRDHSALEAMLARASAEQREKDAVAAYQSRLPDVTAASQAAAAIRAGEREPSIERDE